MLWKFSFILSAENPNYCGYRNQPYIGVFANLHDFGCLWKDLFPNCVRIPLVTTPTGGNEINNLKAL